MDPDANLAEQLDIAREIMAVVDGVDEEEGKLTREEAEDLAGHAVRLAELVQALNTWIHRSGNPPHAWTRDHAGWHQDGFVPTVS